MKVNMEGRERKEVESMKTEPFKKIEKTTDTEFCLNFQEREEAGCLSGSQSPGHGEPGVS